MFLRVVKNKWISNSVKYYYTSNMHNKKHKLGFIIDIDGTLTQGSTPLKGAT